MSTVLRSQIRCLECDNLVASIHRHDFRFCPCGHIAIDGGRDYLRLYGEGVSDGKWENSQVMIEEDLSNPDAAKVLTTLKALAAISPHDRPRSGRPLSMVTNAVAQEIWRCRGNPGPRPDHRPSEYSVRKDLECLRRNGLVERTQVGNRGRVSWRSLVELAEHPEA